jgi:DNA-binding Lrp family transcriptional regulator
MLKLISFIVIERKQSKHIVSELKKIAEIIKIMTISGEADILIEIRAEKNEEAIFVIEKIEKITGIIEIHSHFVMDEWIK